jgi:8-oxo-dGTP diphosphatase
MDISELTREMHNFVRSMGWYQADSQRPQTLRNLAVSLNLEASEVLEHFQWNDSPLDLDALASELADVALYLLQLASLSGIDLEEAILDKLQVNYQRSWDGNAPTVSDSAHGSCAEENSSPTRTS